MKWLVCTLFLISSFVSFSQEIDLSKKEKFDVNLAISAGSLKTDLVLNNTPIHAFVISPKLEFGGFMKVHIGGNILTIDPGVYDTIRQSFGHMEFGFSGEKQLNNQPVYLKGGYLVRVNEYYGHRVFGQVGITSADVVDFHLIFSRLYDRTDIFTGTMLEFGARINLN